MIGRAVVSRLARALAAALVLGWAAGPAWCLNPATPLSQYGHSSWRIRDGAFVGAPNNIAQTSDGYLWLATRSGLCRFDGIKFVAFKGPADAEPIRSPYVGPLMAGRDGSLWIGTDADLERWHNGVLTHYPAQRGYVEGSFVQVYEAKDGTVWAAKFRRSDSAGPLCKVSGADLQCFGERDGISLNSLIGFLFEDADGGLWMNSDRAILHWDPKTRKALPGGLTVPGSERIEFVMPDANGTVLVGLGADGLWQIRDGALVPYHVGDADLTQIDARQFWVDRRGVTWVGTEGKGLYRIWKNRVDHYGRADGLSSDTVDALGEDSEGNLWVGTSEGMDRFRDSRVLTFSAREGLSEELVLAVLATRDGSVWVNNLRSLDRIKDGAVTSYKTGRDIPGALITTLYEDRDGRLLVGADDQMFELQDGHFSPFIKQGNSHIERYQSIVEDRDGSYWAVVGGGPRYTRIALLHIERNRVVEAVESGRLPLAPLAPIAADPGGGVWLTLEDGDLVHWRHGVVETVALGRAPHSGFATGLLVEPDGDKYIATRQGLIVVRAHSVKHMTLVDGLPCQYLHAMVPTPEALWFAADCGYFSMQRQDLEQWWLNPASHPKITLLDPLDGAQPAGAAFIPRATRSADGKIWWATHSLLQMVDPHDTTFNRQPPPVHVEALIADNMAHALGGRLRLPAGTRNIQIDYNGLSFVIPEKVRFKYRLVGHHENWIDAQTRRQAFYTDLGPGTYRFEVAACNNDGVWSAPVAVDFAITPNFYQTRWFDVLSVAVVLGLLYLLYLMRVRQYMARVRLRMQAQSVERERIARDLHDTLLQGLQALIVKLDALVDTVPLGALHRDELRGTLTHADSLMAEGRRRVVGMRATLLQGDLCGLIGATAQVLQSQSACRYALTLQGRPRPLTAKTQEEIYRVAVEALTNVFRHANATHAKVEVHFSSSALTVTVSDDGRGFDPAQALRAAERGHFGLVGMRERCDRVSAQLSIRSAPGAGCEIRIKVPAAHAYSNDERMSIWSWMYRLWRLDQDEA